MKYFNLFFAIFLLFVSLFAGFSFDVQAEDQVTSTAIYSEISSGNKHTCALTSGGQLVCWGSNEFGQIGSEGYSFAARSTPGLVPGLEDMVISKFVSGPANTCIITDQGALYCWGSNNSHELGNPDYYWWAHGAPVPVSGMYANVLDVSIGNGFVCALKDSGDAFCWGMDYYESYNGDSGWVYRAEPELIGHITDPKGIYSNGGHTCMLSNSGIAMCWGLGGSGQLGDGEAIDQQYPVQVSNLSNITSLALGEYHTCAITGETESQPQKLWCWRDHSRGQLGIDLNTPIDNSKPIEVTELSGIPIEIAAGWEHTCAIVQNEGINSVQCWGYNQEGQLGIGNTTSMNFPTDVTGTSGAIKISAGESFTTILTNSGKIKTWGANTEGQLGNGFFFRRQLPIHLDHLSDSIKDVVSGENHACALTQTGDVYCWGGNLHGQLGNGTTVYSATPVKVVGIEGNVTSLSAGIFHNCAKLESNEIKCWGYNINGILGTDNMEETNLSIPEFVIDPETELPLTGIEKISTGGWHNCVLMENGVIKCWGSDLFGQLGIEPPVDSYLIPYPVEVPFTGIFTDVTVGMDHSCAVASDGNAYCWGVNYNGELGIGSYDFDPHHIPSMVLGLENNVIKIDSGREKTCVLTSEGGVSCWGGSSIDHTAVPVQGLESGVADISSGGALTYMTNHSCALMENDRSVKCWGSNNFSQLGDGSYRFFGDFIPVDVLGLAGNVQSISTGATSSCAIFESGSAACWGSDYQIETTPQNLVEVDEMFRPPSIFFSNYYEGAPESYFVITGLYFPPNEQVHIYINEEQVGSVLANETGVFKFFTYFDVEGEYTVRVESAVTQTIQSDWNNIKTLSTTSGVVGQGEVFINVIEGSLPRIKEGDGLTIGTKTGNSIFLPLVVR